VTSVVRFERMTLMSHFLQMNQKHTACSLIQFLNKKDMNGITNSPNFSGMNDSDEPVAFN